LRSGPGSANSLVQAEDGAPAGAARWQRLDKEYANLHDLHATPEWAVNEIADQAKR